MVKNESRVFVEPRVARDSSINLIVFTIEKEQCIIYVIFIIIFKFVMVLIWLMTEKQTNKKKKKLVCMCVYLGTWIQSMTCGGCCQIDEKSSGFKQGFVEGAEIINDEKATKG